ncbi:MAG: hypothetical protein HQ501_10865, partial [Rhodospirillales bacterium]|nr:hypothetical protein [Rhodospirillales bacterium]
MPVLAAVSILIPCLSGAPAYGQDATTGNTQGQVRIQGRDNPQEEIPIDLGETLLVDFREEMRKFIQGISSYARRIRPEFAVVVENGSGLTIKTDPTDDTIVMPASGFTRSIDG